jgi:hypothetical protein
VAGGRVRIEFGGRHHPIHRPVGLDGANFHPDRLMVGWYFESDPSARVGVAIGQSELLEEPGAKAGGCLVGCLNHQRGGA